MKTVINGENVVIKFAYGEYEPLPESFPNKNKKLTNVYPRRETTCYIRKDVPGERVDPFKEVVVKNDSRIRFSTSMARKYSLAKLLSALGVSKSERTRVWMDMFKQCPNTVKFVNKTQVKNKKKSVEPVSSN